MGKELEQNADWIARDHGRVPSKGARAAERASAGIGATDHDAELLAERLVLGAAVPAKRTVKSPPQRPQ
jgi:hypothetical protein